MINFYKWPIEALTEQQSRTHQKWRFGLIALLNTIYDGIIWKEICSMSAEIKDLDLTTSLL